MSDLSFAILEILKIKIKYKKENFLGLIQSLYFTSLFSEKSINKMIMAVDLKLNCDNKNDYYKVKIIICKFTYSILHSKKNYAQ